MYGSFDFTYAVLGVIRCPIAHRALCAPGLSWHLPATKVCGILVLQPHIYHEAHPPKKVHQFVRGAPFLKNAELYPQTDFEYYASKCKTTIKLMA